MEEPTGHFIYKGCQEFAGEEGTSIITKNFSAGSPLEVRAYGTRGSHKTWLVDSDRADGSPPRDQVAAQKLEEQNY